MVKEAPRMTSSQNAEFQIESGPRRIALLICGWCNVVLGMIGAIIPGMPTTVFLIIALWAFTRSSPRLRRWLYEHPRYGPALCDWDRHGVIPPRAKRLAGSMMAASLLIIAWLASSWITPAIVGGVMATVMLFILTRPSYPLPIISADK
jgi:uncharacterized membrane protein YbaN (DUF454 family)